MKNITLASFRAAALAAALLVAPAIASAHDNPAQVLASSGAVPVKDAGPYVHPGSYRIHVWTTLGRPSAVLADGTYLYRDFGAQDNAIRGTLVVRFDRGRVSQLSLVSPAVETALLTAPAGGKGAVEIASK
jgi:hypothetical protein